ncbi:hypothetical protein [Paraburkholderia youngii]|uniref:HTH luxR-type domain-containing protein n=1 Tax=Paraburkholderia youngii TaxID=2782701 RepID=A0A7Y6K7Z9_9BURK|nr:hypothetical protein [Paraburkholderia youngii]NUY06112.1 hypothetical protein [Paraburkholderia youngii]
MSMQISADEFRAQVLHTLHARISFNAHIWSTGTRNSSGSIVISPDFSTEGLPSNFVSDYAGIAPHDVVGYLFSAFPRVVQPISVADYRGPRGGRVGATIADYLDAIGIRYLMNCGLESRFGIAWITMYRRDAPKVTEVVELVPFSPADAEIAAYSVPHWLYTWQELAAGQISDRDSSGKWPMGVVPRLLGLTPMQMRVATLAVRGLGAKEIARALKLEGRNANANTIAVHLKRVHKKVGMHCEDLAQALLGPIH